MMTVARLDPVDSAPGFAARSTSGRGAPGSNSTPLLPLLPLILGAAVATRIEAILGGCWSNVAGRDQAVGSRALPRESLGRRFGLHWPNDLVIGDTKLGGFLVERRRIAVGGVWRWATAAGLGLNLFDAPDVPVSSGGRPAIDLRSAMLAAGQLECGFAAGLSQAPEAPAGHAPAPNLSGEADRGCEALLTALRDCVPGVAEPQHGSVLERWAEALCIAMMSAWDECIPAISRSGTYDDERPRRYWLEHWARLDVLRGVRVRVETPSGDREGVAMGIDGASGALQVRDDDGELHPIHAGDVTRCRPV